MTDSNQQCPSNWTLHDTSTSGRSCIRPNTITIGCASTFFSTGSVDYNRVCGRAIGIASISPDGYREIGNNRGHTVNDPYVDGLSTTHGSPRQHIWTFVAGPQNQGGTAPPFVGEDYFCDEIGGGNLWDGVNCPTATCCTINTHLCGLIECYLAHPRMILKYAFVLMRAIAMKLLASNCWRYSLNNSFM